MFLCIVLVHLISCVLSLNLSFKIPVRGKKKREKRQNGGCILLMYENVYRMTQPPVFLGGSNSCESFSICRIRELKQSPGKRIWEEQLVYVRILQSSLRFFKTNISFLYKYKQLLIYEIHKVIL